MKKYFFIGGGMAVCSILILFAVWMYGSVAEVGQSEDDSARAALHELQRQVNSRFSNSLMTGGGNCQAARASLFGQAATHTIIRAATPLIGNWSFPPDFILSDLDAIPMEYLINTSESSKKYFSPAGFIFIPQCN